MVRNNLSMNLGRFLRNTKDSLVGDRSFLTDVGKLEELSYPLDLEFTLDRIQTYYYPMDREGIPLREYRSVGIQYNPTRVAAYGLAHFNRYLLRKCAHGREIFLKTAGWFMREKEGLWHYHFDWDDLKSPWLSAMAQGEGISVLVRAYRLTGDEAYLRNAVLASKPFSVYVDGGGVRSRIDGRLEFLEEYPSRNPRHTLNGFLYALVGICDLVEVSPEIRELAGLNPLIVTLREKISLWDLSYWSAYDLHHTTAGRRNVATVTYHNLHITLLRYLGGKLEAKELIETAERWEASSLNLSNRLRALLGKTLYRLAVPPPR